MTKRLFVHLILVVLIGIWAILYEDYGMLLLFVVLLLLPIIFFIFNIFARNKLELGLSVTKGRLVKGNIQEIVIKMNNKTLLPVIILDVDLEFENVMHGVMDVTRKKLYTVRRGTQSKTIQFRSSCCGNINVTIKKAYILDIFRLTKVRMKAEATTMFPVLPHIGLIDSDEMPVNTAVAVDSDVFSKTKKGDDVSEVFDLRPYREGDRLNTVNWKISGKTEELIIKELSLPVGNGIVIMVELYDDKKSSYSQDYIDMQLETALTISVKLIKELGYVHYIAWYDKLNNCCQRIKVTENTSLTQVAAALLSCRIYEGDYYLALNYYNQFCGETDAHIYYITTGFTALSLDSISYSQKCAIKKMLLVSTSERFVTKEARLLVEGNDMYLHVIELANRRSLVGFEL